MKKKMHKNKVFGTAEAEKEVVVLSLGGSVIVPEHIDVDFLRAFRALIKDYAKKYRFAIVTGGGRIAREYIAAGSAILKLGNERDWLGIWATQLNARLLQTILKDVAEPEILTNPTKKIRFKKVLVASGWKPGFSTDYDAVMLAKNYGAKVIVNMTNVDWLYDKDPKKFKNAKKIERTDWKRFRKIIGDKWVPAKNYPFDPVATKAAEKLGLKLVLIGKDLNNFRNYLDGKRFRGSIIE